VIGGGRKIEAVKQRWLRRVAKSFARASCFGFAQWSTYGIRWLRGITLTFSARAILPGCEIKSAGQKQ
jgi:hypothetical protein